MSMFTNTMRFTGFSGIDTDSMVRQIMQAESIRLHRFQRNRQTLQWRQQDYRGIQSQLTNFRDRFLTSLGQDSLVLESVMNSRTATVSNPSLGVTAVPGASGAQVGNFTVNVTQMANAHRFSGSQQDVSINAQNPLNLNNISSGDTFRIALDNGTSREIDLYAIASDPSVTDEASFVSALNNVLSQEFGTHSGTGSGMVQASLSPSGHLSFDTATSSNRITITNGGGAGLANLGGITSGSTNTMNMTTTLSNFFEPGFFTNGSHSLQINGTTINLTETMTVQEMTVAINSSDAGVTMNFNSLTASFTLSSDTIGSAGIINSPDIGTAGGFFDSLGLVADPNTGQNALVEITSPDGTTTVLERNSNSINLVAEFGITLTINQATVGAGPINVEVAEDRSRTRNTITTFVEEYNNLVRELHELRNTSRPRGSGNSHFDPLLPHERESMSDSEITRWEEQAREGLLHRSQTIERTLADMRRTLAQGIELEDGTRKSLWQFGITTEQNGTLLTLQIDQSRLDTALETIDPAQTMEFFRDLANDLSTTISNNITTINQLSGSGGTLNNTLQNRINDIDSRVIDMERRLAARETALFAQFARMESAIMQSNSQMDFLFSMMSG